MYKIVHVNKKQKSICNPSTGEAKAAKSQVWGQPGCHTEFQDRLLKKTNKKIQITKVFKKEMLHIYKYHLVPTNETFWWLGIREAVLEMQMVVWGGMELKLNSVANRELMYIW